MNQQENEGPEFALLAYIDEDDGGGAIDLDVKIRQNPSETEEASNALLFGLAVLMLNQSGAIDDVMHDICVDGAPTEAEVARQIELLMMDDGDGTFQLQS